MTMSRENARSVMQTGQELMVNFFVPNLKSTVLAVLVQEISAASREQDAGEQLLMAMARARARAVPQDAPEFLPPSKFSIRFYSPKSTAVHHIAILVHNAPNSTQSLFSQSYASVRHFTTLQYASITHYQHRHIIVDLPISHYVIKNSMLCKHVGMIYAVLYRQRRTR